MTSERRAAVFGSPENKCYRPFKVIELGISKPIRVIELGISKPIRVILKKEF